MQRQVNKGTKQKLDELHTAGRVPEKLKTSEAIGLRQGNSIIKLVDNSGAKTPAGLYWEQKEGAPPLPDGGFLQQAPRRDGNTETIALRDGRRAVTRRWDAGSGSFAYTALG